MSYPDESVPVSFPGLGNLQFWVHRTAFSIGPLVINWYGLIITLGLVLALIYAVRRSKEFGVSVDDLTDVTLWSVIFGIVGARLYYVIFYDAGYYFSHPVEIVKVWNGGLAIYGGVIGAAVTVIVACRVKKISPLPLFDLAGLGFLIGQGIGRWGNFFNREAYGVETNLPWRMVIDSSGTGYHPCFLYESVWCLLGFVLLHLYSKHRKFRGELFLLYAAWYSFERFSVEGLRTDSLMVGPVRVSQLLSALVFVASVATLCVVYTRRRRRAAEDAKPYVPLYADTIAEERRHEAEAGQSDSGAAQDEPDAVRDESGSAGAPGGSPEPDGSEKPESSDGEKGKSGSVSDPDGPEENGADQPGGAREPAGNPRPKEPDGTRKPGEGD